MTETNDISNIYEWLKPVDKINDFPKSRLSELIKTKGKIFGWEDIGSGVEYQLDDCSINKNERIDFLNNINDLLSTTNYKNNEHYLKYWKLIQNQADLNSPKFSSHGIDHSLRVVNDMLILSGIPLNKYKSNSPRKSSRKPSERRKSSTSNFDAPRKSSRKTSERRKSSRKSSPPILPSRDSLFMIQFKKKYPSPAVDNFDNIEQIINSVIWAGLLHDIGYAEFDLCSREHKFKETNDLLLEQRFIFNLLKSSLCNGMFKDSKLCKYDLSPYHNIKKAGDGNLWNSTKPYLKKSTKKSKNENVSNINVSNTTVQQKIQMFEKKSKKSSKTKSNYPCVDTVGFNSTYYRKNKFLHALLGYRALFDIELHFELLWPKFREDILHSIKYHNFDDPNSKTYIPSKHGNFFTIGEHDDTKMLEESYNLLTNEEKKLIPKEEFNLDVERTYIEASLEDSPLLALVRLADNLDITYERLTIEQRSPVIILYQQWFRKEYMKIHTIEEKSGDSNVMSDMFNSGKIPKGSPKEGLKDLNDTYTYNKNIKWNELLIAYPNEQLSIDILNLLRDNTNYNEFLFQYGSWIIKSLSSKLTQNFELNITIELNDGGGEIKPGNNLEIQYNWGPGIDQLVRMNSAFKSIKYEGKSLNKRTYITLLGKTISLDKLSTIKTYEEFESYKLR
jgi:hypothetical protein